MKMRIERRYNNAAAVYKGSVDFHAFEVVERSCLRPLLYALQIGENYTALRNYSFESKDYQVIRKLKWATSQKPVVQILNTTVWNYGLWLDDDSNPEKYLQFSYRGLQSNASPFSIAGSPAMIKAKVTRKEMPSNFFFQLFVCRAMFFLFGAMIVDPPLLHLPVR